MALPDHSETFDQPDAVPVGVGQEAVIPTEFTVPSLLIATSLQFSDEESLRERLQELQELDEA